MYRLSAIIAGVVLLAGSVSAHAEEGSMTVRVSDLNLNTAAGARVALARAESAAESFCGEADIRQLYRYQLTIACRRTMVSRAVEAMDAPKVTALHQQTSSVTVARR